MRNLVITLLFALVMFGCITEKKRAKICATCTLHSAITDSVSVKDSVAKTAVVKTLTVEVIKTVTLSTPNPCADLCDSLGRLRENFRRTVVSTSGTAIDLSVKNNELIFNDRLDGLRLQIQFMDTAITHYKNTLRIHSEIKQEPARCDRDHVTKWIGFMVISAEILWTIVLLFLGWKAWKYYRKFHLPL